MGGGNIVMIFSLCCRAFIVPSKGGLCHLNGQLLVGDSSSFTLPGGWEGERSGLCPRALLWRTAGLTAGHWRGRGLPLCVLDQLLRPGPWSWSPGLPPRTSGQVLGLQLPVSQRWPPPSTTATPARSLPATTRTTSCRRPLGTLTTGPRKLDFSFAYIFKCEPYTKKN